MGILSDSARKAYRTGTRRAHVPEWFAPAAYVFGGVVGLVLVLGILFSDLPEAAPVVTDGAVVVIDGDGATATTNAAENVATTLPADPAGTVPAPVGGDERVALLDGGTATLPAGAWPVAQQVTFALLTGDFSQVTVYPGKTAPILLTTWDEPSILGLVAVEENADGSLRVVLRVDPDVSGREPARDVPILLAASEGGWAYLPG